MYVYRLQINWEIYKKKLKKKFFETQCPALNKELQSNKWELGTEWTAEFFLPTRPVYRYSG
jgi:hypothetical protein